MNLITLLKVILAQRPTCSWASRCIIQPVSTACLTPVSYTHLDVYKRQLQHCLRSYACWSIPSVSVNVSLTSKQNLSQTRCSSRSYCFTVLKIRREVSVHVYSSCCRWNIDNGRVAHYVALLCCRKLPLISSAGQNTIRKLVVALLQKLFFFKHNS